jgi:hypothetical protein
MRRSLLVVHHHRLTEELEGVYPASGKYGVNGLSYSPKLSSTDTAKANCLATHLDNYNNDRSASAC